MKLCNVNKICLKASFAYPVSPRCFEIPKRSLKPTSKTQSFLLIGPTLETPGGGKAVFMAFPLAWELTLNESS